MIATHAPGLTSDHAFDTNHPILPEITFQTFPFKAESLILVFYPKNLLVDTRGKTRWVYILIMGTFPFPVTAGGRRLRTPVTCLGLAGVSFSLIYPPATSGRDFGVKASETKQVGLMRWKHCLRNFGIVVTGDCVAKRNIGDLLKCWRNLTQWKDYRVNILEGLSRQHRGRIIESTLCKDYRVH
ncbi:hypothetical protein CEXT_503881 [Caerostris extrusa]|uniref:Uncharacterized protein n=1 Tax=Caerostris extrusa TaxID=172846 RepID=A0AAV4VWM9_CAEEX|nr:hypothetical protein CEXT_503881 [Caerostris extrusa]